MDVKSVFISCSHPLLTNFDNMRIDLGDKLKPDQDVKIPVRLRMAALE